MNDELAGQEEPQGAVAPVNALERFRGMRAAIGEVTTRDVPIPGYEDQLGMRQHRVEWKTLRRIAGVVEKNKNPMAELMAQADTIIQATTCIVARQSPGAPWTEAEASDGEPYLWDSRLAEVLGIPAGSARQVVRGVFNNDLALSASYADYMAWAEESSVSDEEFLGES